MDEVKKEFNKLIATRVPPGDRYCLLGDPKKIVYKSLTDTLEAYFKQTKKLVDFKLCPSKGELYAIEVVKEKIEEIPPKKYNIYGEDI